MIEIIANGVQLGIVLTFLVGPVFFTIIQTSIERGFWRGVLVAVGVSISDILYVAICYFGFAQVLASSILKVYMAYAGGIILIGFGLYHLLIKSRAKPINPLSSIQEKRLFRYIIKGFVINGMTPMVLFFWIGTVSLATINFGYAKGGEFVLFFASMLLTILTTDVLFVVQSKHLCHLCRRIVECTTPESPKDDTVMIVVYRALVHGIDLLHHQIEVRLVLVLTVGVELGVPDSSTSDEVPIERLFKKLVVLVLDNTYVRTVHNGIGSHRVSPFR